MSKKSNSHGVNNINTIVIKERGMATNKSRRDMARRVDEILSAAGFDVDRIDNNSFYNLENLLHIEHYNISGTSKRRTGHSLLSSFSKRRIEKDFEYILGD